MRRLRVTTYDDGNSLYDTVLELITAAQNRVWIKIPWWDTSPQARRLLDAVIAAKQRGVDVLVLCRPEASNDAVLRKLRRADISLTSVRYIHEKELIADDVAVTHSMNFTRTEIERNQNSGSVFDTPEEIDDLEAGFRTLLDNREAVSVGEEEWTPSSVLIPPDFQKFLTRYDRLNPLQSKAVPVVLSSPGHVMVVAPTSAGKTLIGEVAALRSIVGEGRPAVWLLPARALAAEIGETAKRWNEHGIRAIELTGETNMSSEAVRKAQLWVATTEKFEALYRRSSLREFIGSVGCLIIDEVHLVGDPERGATLESLIARLRAAEARTRIVALSATVSNADELASWFRAQLIRSAWRPTILNTQFVAYDAPAVEERRELHESAKDRALRDLLGELVDTAGQSMTVGGGAATAEGGVLVFCGSKNAVRRTAALVAGVEFREVDDEQLIDAAFARGVGIHFRDAPRAGRALTAFKERDIRVLVATSGLSTGVNTPARFVVIRDLELGISALEVSQAQQMFGRAGRAGQEPEGFGFMLVPRDQEALWRHKLADGYTARSRVVDRLADTVLAEILLRSVRHRSDASTWFQETFAYAQAREVYDVDEALDFLVRRGFVTESEDGLAVTEIGALTSRLMIDVESAAELLAALAEVPVPADAAEAEEYVLQMTASGVRSLREWPVNQRTYEAVVQEALSSWSRRVTSRLGSHFGSRFCLAATHLALRDPRRLHAKPPRGMSLADFRRAIDEMPRYLAWIGALGYLGSATWAPAVAGDLARRLSWWTLSPRPERGSGRLLGMLERTLHPENRRMRMQNLWGRARQNGYSSPDRINARPRNVDVSTEEFAQVARSRADLQLAVSDRLTLPVTAATAQSRVTVLSSIGTRRAVSTVCPVLDRIELALPPGSEAGSMAADVFLYTRDGDFAYRNVVVELPDDAVGTRLDPLVEAARLVDDLPVVAVVVKKKFSGLRRLLSSERKKRRMSLLPLLAPDPQLRPVALALAEHEAEPERAVLTLRANLRAFLAAEDSHVPRPAAVVLRSGHACDDEFELTLAALVGALQFDTGAAISGEKVVALVKISGEWHLAAPTKEPFVQVEPVVPEELPPVIRTVQEREHDPDATVTPLCDWMQEFTQL